MNFLLRIALFFFFYICALGAYAESLRVEEVRILIQENMVTGYQVDLDRPARKVKSNILDHLQLYTDGAFGLDGLLIFENISYTPITHSRPITLYYQVKKSEGIATRLTLVAMYDYKRSINSVDFPDLTLKMLKDLSVLVKSINQADLDFGHVFVSHRMKETTTYYPPASDLRSILISRNPAVVGLMDNLFPKELLGSGASTHRSASPAPVQTEGIEIYLDTIISLRKKLIHTLGELSGTRKTLFQTQEEMLMLQSELDHEDQLLAPYRDTINILKDGVYGYGILLEEQQAFIDTLLETLATSPKTTAKNYKALTFSDEPDPIIISDDIAVEATRDSIQHLLDIQYATQEMMRLQQSSIDSLRVQVDELKSRPQEVNAPPQTVVLTESEFMRNKRALDSLQAAIENFRKKATQSQPSVSAETYQLKREIRMLQYRNTAISDSLNRQKQHITHLEINNERLSSQVKVSMLDSQKQKAASAELLQKIEQKDKEMIHAAKTVEQARLEIEKVQKVNERYMKRFTSMLDAYDNVNARADSLGLIAQKFKDNYYDLASVNDSLRLEIDLLNPYSESARARRRVYQEQLNQLSLLEKRLPRWESEIKAREKLLRQRERYLKEFEKGGDISTLLDRIGSLEKEIKRLTENLE